MILAALRTVASTQSAGGMYTTPAPKAPNNLNPLSVPATALISANVAAAPAASPAARVSTFDAPKQTLPPPHAAAAVSQSKAASSPAAPAVSAAGSSNPFAAPIAPVAAASSCAPAPASAFQLDVASTAVIHNAKVDSLRQIVDPSTSLSRLIVSLEAGHPELAIAENQQELAEYMSTEGSINISANAALWAYHTILGFCYVWVKTIVSREIAAGKRYIARPSPARGKKCKRSINSFVDHLRSVMSDETVAETLFLMKAGLVHASMAAPLGEKERAAAFDQDNPMAWIELQPPASNSKMAAASKAALYIAKTVLRRS